ncbi:MAG: rRNA maturation RNase YbeY [Ilumatobacteraceae bacterium]
MAEPPSPTLTTGADAVIVVGADEQAATDGVDVDVERWSELARAVLVDEARRGELTLTFVDRAEIAALNAEHLGHAGPTDVLSFPLDDGDVPEAGHTGVPVLLGDIVVCPAVAVEQAPSHAGTADDEIALLVVHGVLHVLGHDHAEPDETAAMRTRERVLLERHHWAGPAPAGFRQDQP